MQSTLNPKQANPDDVVVVPPDVVRVAPSDKEFADPAHGAKGRPSDPQVRSGSAAGASVPPVDTTFRAAAVNSAKANGERSSFGSAVMRVLRSFLIAMVLALITGAVAFGWQNYADTAKEIIVDWLPEHMPTSISSLFSSGSSPQGASAPAQQPGSTAPQAVATVATPAQAVPPATNADAATAPAAQASDGAAPAPAAAASADSVQLLQSMAHDLATVGQDIAQLKASVDQLKASQEQMARELARVREQNRPKVAAVTPTPRPTALTLPPRRPPLYPPQAAVAGPSRVAPPPAPQTVGAVPPPRSTAPPMPYAAAPPVSLQPDAQTGADQEDAPVVRPPMPVR